MSSKTLTKPQWSQVYREMQFKTKVGSAAEAIKEARLDWEVEQTELTFQTGKGKWKICQNENFARYTMANINKKTGECIGVVGNKYAVVQNTDAFEFMDEVAGQNKLIYTGAGQFQGGRMVWIQAKLPENMILFREDIIEKKLTLITSHDGSCPIGLLFTPNRIACTNQLVHVKRDVTIRHFQNFKEKVSKARVALGLALDFYKGFEADAKAMTDVKLDGKRLKSYFDSVLEIDGEEASAQRLERRDRFSELFEKGKGNDIKGVRGTLWAAYNAVAEFADHSQEPKEDGSEMLRSSWLGSGAVLKSRAWDEAKELVEVRK